LILNRTNPHRHDENLFSAAYNRFATVGSTTVPSIWQQHHEVKLPVRTLDRV